MCGGVVKLGKKVGVGADGTPSQIEIIGSRDVADSDYGVLALRRPDVDIYGRPIGPDVPIGTDMVVYDQTAMVPYDRSNLSSLDAMADRLASLRAGPLRLTNTPDVVAPRDGAAPPRESTLSNLTAIASAALAAGVPIAALAAYLSSVTGSSGGPAGPAGPAPTTQPPRPPPPPPVVQPPRPPTTTIDRTRPDVYAPTGPSGTNLTRGATGRAAAAARAAAQRRGEADIAYYLETGNLPSKYRQRGSGKSDGRSARAAIVRKVMGERGMSMIEASKYVKAHNLY